jgi:hypothetical protein
MAQAITLLDVMAPTVDLLAYHLWRGQVGTVVERLAGGITFEIECSDREGHTAVYHVFDTSLTKRSQDSKNSLRRLDGRSDGCPDEILRTRACPIYQRNSRPMTSSVARAPSPMRNLNTVKTPWKNPMLFLSRLGNSGPVRHAQASPDRVR